MVEKKVRRHGKGLVQHRHMGCLQEGDYEAVLPQGCGILGSEENEASQAHRVNTGVCQGAFRFDA